ncbi:hypothetical protein XELAEV_18001424mg [Xenopus laevis]|nr:hypothetical protein XELAEV_18001424mg [Xenopus laevis]
MELEEQLQETLGGSDGSSERSEESVPSKSHVRSSSIKEMFHTNYGGGMEVPKWECEVTDTSSEEAIMYLRTDMGTDMRSESSRCRSFIECNDSRPAPLYSLWTLLSQAGFYYVGPGDRVRCFSCGGELENWEYWDVPLTRHQRSFPDCPYVLELRAEMSPIIGQYQYQFKKRLSPTVPSSSNCPTVQGLIKDPDYSKVESITEGESETSVPPSGSSISGQKPLRTMSDENNRLETYQGHRHHFPYNNQRSLSQAGFYYVGPGDRLRCFSCGGELDTWEDWDVSLNRHQRSFPDCPFVLERRAEMSPIIGQYQPHMSERLSPTVPRSSDCPTARGQIRDLNYSKVESTTEGESETSAPPSGSSISGQKPLGTMRDKQNRLETYRGHRHHFPHNNRWHLSQAGFYYVGPGDRVWCFSCGGELENWKYWDDPLTRHRLSFPNCPYVLELAAKRLRNLSTELNEYLSYRNNFRLLGVPSSSVTHCDKTKYTDQEEGLSDPIKEWASGLVDASGQVGEEISGHVEKGPPGQVEKGPPGQMEEGPPGQVEEGPPGQVEEGPPGQVEEEMSGQVEEDISGQVEEGPSSQVGQEISGQVEEGPSGQVGEEICGQVEEGPSSQVGEEIAGQVGEEISGQVEEGVYGQVGKGIPSQIEVGASCQVEVELRVQKEETCDWPRGSAEECELCGKIPEVPRISPQRSGTKYRRRRG